MKSVSNNANASLFVDDFAVYIEGKHLKHLERSMQLCINKIQKWVAESGFKFSISKTTCAHVAYLKKKCQKALNILRVVGHTDWGADKSTLLKLYRTLVRSKLDYGCAVWLRKTLYIEITRPYPPSGSPHCARCFPHFTCAKSVCGGGGAVSQTQKTQTVYDLFS